jgi:hypothetical protein
MSDNHAAPRRAECLFEPPTTPPPGGRAPQPSLLQAALKVVS